MANGLSGANLNSIRILWDSGTLSGLDDRTLLGRFVDRRDEGAELAFEVLVRRHGAMVLRVCEQLLGDRHAAEDAFQAVFLVLARRAGSIRAPEQLAPWLHGVALRTAKEARSRERKRRRMELRGATMQPTSSDPPEHTLVRFEEAEALHNEIARLPDRYRGPVVLCDLEGLTHQEAAIRLRCPIGTVAIRLKRARERLRARLSRRGLDPSAGVMVLALDPGTLPRLSTSLVQSTVRASMAAGVGSALALSLAIGVEMAMTPAKWATATVGLALGLASIWGLADWLLHTRQQQVPAEVAPEVEVVQPVAREFRDYVVYVGVTEPSRSLEIRANIDGRLETACFPGGKSVKEGDLLFEIDKRRAQAALEIAEAEVLEAETRLTPVLARAELLKTEFGAASLKKTKANLGVAEAVRDQAKLVLASTRIEAPFDGYISRSRVAPGDPIQGSKTILATLAATDPMAVAFKVDERTILSLTRMERDEGLNINDLPVRVNLAGDKGFHREARIKSRSEEIDPQTGTGTFRATVPNPDLFLLPGMSGQVRMGIGKAYGTLLVPEAAVLTDEGRKFLYVLGDRDRVELRTVTLGQTQEDLRVVREGLKPGDRVVLHPQKDLKPGMAIKPRSSPVASDR